MERRHFLISLGALLGFPAAPAAIPAAAPHLKPLPAPESRSANELFMAGYHVEAVIVSLCEDTKKVDGFSMNQPNLNSKVQFSEISSEGIVATGKALNVTVVENKDACWLDCSDLTFFCVSGQEVGSLLIAFQFNNGEAPVVGITDAFFGLPCTPNGGDITVVIPSTGLVRLS